MQVCYTESLFKKYEDHFRIGVAVDYENIQHYHEIILKHFNSITPENNMKFANIHSQEHVYNWNQMDNLIEYTRINKLYMRGHTLVWHEQIPEWVMKFEGNSHKLKHIMCDHIATLMDRYRNAIDSWDVINEAFSDGTDVYRNTLWFRTMGEKYIDYAFCAAKEADSKSLLFLNEYNGHMVEKRSKIINSILTMKKRGVPIDGIGIQGHYNIDYPGIKIIQDEIEAYARLGLKIQITELDISLFNFYDRRTNLLHPTEDMIKKQEQLYFDLFSIYEKYKDYILSVTFWGVADDHTWLHSFPVSGRMDWPLLFDENLQEKQVLRCLVERR